MAFVALFFSFSTHLTLSLIAFLLAFLASALTLVAFGVDIALYVHVKYEMRKLNSGDNTLTGPGQSFSPFQSNIEVAFTDLDML